MHNWPRSERQYHTKADKIPFPPQHISFHGDKEMIKKNLAALHEFSSTEKCFTYKHTMNFVNVHTAFGQEMEAISGFVFVREISGRLSGTRCADCGTCLWAGVRGPVPSGSLGAGSGPQLRRAWPHRRTHLLGTVFVELIAFYRPLAGLTWPSLNALREFLTQW